MLCSCNAAFQVISDGSSGGICIAETLSRKEVVYLLDNRDDPETDAGIKAFMKQAYADAAKPAAEEPVSADDDLELTTKIEKKYIAAQVVESGIQVCLRSHPNNPRPKAFSAGHLHC
jgi:hypothetical protein